MDCTRLEEIITCGICFEKFNEDSRCPRILFCGHTFCHFCLDKILVQSPCCPTCKTVMKYKNAERIPINFIARSMIVAVKQETITESGDSSLPVLRPNSNQEKLPSVGYCSEHSYFQELRCMDCESWICAMCVFLNHKRCRTLLVKEAYKELKKKVTEKVEDELETMNTVSVGIIESLKLLNKERKEFIEEIKKKESELKNLDKRIEDLETQKSEGTKFCRKLRGLSALIRNSTDDDVFAKAINELDDLLDRGKRQVTLLEALEISIPRSIESLKNLFERQSIYVVEGEAEPLYGMVNIKKGRIWISSFQQEKPNALLFSFKELLLKFNGTSELPRRGFLKLTPKDDMNEVVEVEIETDGDLPRGKNFIHLCLALKGQKYKGMHMNCLDSSYYLLNPGPPPAVDGINESFCESPWKDGDVYGMREEDSYFFISLTDIVDCTSPKFGVVVSGLPELKKLVGRNLTVQDCGIIIS